MKLPLDEEYNQYSYDQVNAFMKTMNDDGKQLESMLGEFGKMQDQERKQFVCKTSKFHPENNEYDSAEDEADIKAPQVCWKC